MSVTVATRVSRWLPIAFAILSLVGLISPAMRVVSLVTAIVGGSVWISVDALDSLRSRWKWSCLCSAVILAVAFAVHAHQYRSETSPGVARINLSQEFCNPLSEVGSSASGSKVKLRREIDERLGQVVCVKGYVIPVKEGPQQRVLISVDGRRRAIGDLIGVELAVPIEVTSRHWRGVAITGTLRSNPEWDGTAASPLLLLEEAEMIPAKSNVDLAPFIFVWDC